MKIISFLNKLVLTEEIFTENDYTTSCWKVHKQHLYFSWLVLLQLMEFVGGSFSFICEVLTWHNQQYLYNGTWLLPSKEEDKVQKSEAETFQSEVVVVFCITESSW